MVEYIYTEYTLGEIHNMTNAKIANPALDAAIAEAVVSVVTHKSIWTSKTFWTNVVAAGAMAAQMQWGLMVDPLLQALILAALNIVLRKITDQAVEW